jgi:transcriptional regulator with XRE-family HTH domain
MLLCLLAYQHNRYKKGVNMSFGEIIADARKKQGLSQKDLASRIKKEDGSAISPQYLNDIERDRRNPPSEQILAQFAKELNLSLDYLNIISGKVPEDISIVGYKPEEIEAAVLAFRKTLERQKGK